LVLATDKVDAGLLTKEEIIEPTGWVLLGFIMDPRTGLGRFRNFTISNYSLMEKLIDGCRTMTIDEILQSPDVAERVEMYWQQTEKFKEMVLQYSRVDWDVIVTDLRNVHPIYTGNRFLIYSLFPNQNISVWVMDGKDKENVAIAVGYSIINRTARVDVGSLMLQYGGGGHYRVGTCQVPNEKADEVLKEIIQTIHDSGTREAMDEDEILSFLGEADDLLMDMDA
jgi:nanoRNase/pAp phosphatase (c-di-AMP/oligoRNAs hydrolase)